MKTLFMFLLISKMFPLVKMFFSVFLSGTVILTIVLYSELLLSIKCIIKLKFDSITDVSDIILFKIVPFWFSVYEVFKLKFLAKVLTYFKVKGIEQSEKNTGVLYCISFNSFLSFTISNSRNSLKGKSF